MTVAAGAVVALLPGSHGALAVAGTLLLNPGLYGFASIVLGDEPG